MQTCVVCRDANAQVKIRKMCLPDMHKENDFDFLDSDTPDDLDAVCIDAVCLGGASGDGNEEAGDVDGGVLYTRGMEAGVQLEREVGDGDGGGGLGEQVLPPELLFGCEVSAMCVVGVCV